MKINSNQLLTAVASGLVVAGVIYAARKTAEAVNPTSQNNMANRAFEAATGGRGNFVDAVFQYLNPEAAAIEDSLNDPVDMGLIRDGYWADQREDFIGPPAPPSAQGGNMQPSVPQSSRAGRIGGKAA